MNKEKFDAAKDEVIKRGGLYAVMYFQVTGDKEKAKNLLVERMSKVTSFPGVKLGYAELEEDDEGYISEAHLLVDSIRPLSKIVVLFSPISVEILEPDELTIDNGTLTNMMMDLADISYSLAMMSLSIIAKDKETVKKYQERLKERLERAKRLMKNGKNRD